jgi:hypothetical protein
MYTLNITVINSSALNPASRGKAEKAVGQIKLILKKMLTTSDTLNWDLLPFLITKIYNHTVSPKMKQKPIEMIMGKGPNTKAFFELNFEPKLHHSIKNHEQNVEELSKTLKILTAKGLENYQKLQENQYDAVNKNHIHKTFSKGDIVYVLDRYIFIGNPRPLKSKFYPSPWVVIKAMHTTCLIQRIADGFCTLYSKDAIKKLTKGDPIINNLPSSIRKILEHEFHTYRDKDFQTIALNDALDIPDNTELNDTLPPQENSNEKDNYSAFLPLQGEGPVPEVPLPERSAMNKAAMSLDENDFNSDESDEEEKTHEDSGGIKLRSGKSVRFK